MTSAESFAKRVFFWASIYGFLVIAPQYFLEERIGRDNPPPITHPEHFYGFVGVALAWQLAFYLIARDPQRLRPIIPAAVAEKWLFGIAAMKLLYDGRVQSILGLFAGIDIVLGILFLIAYLRLGLALAEN
ncbi:hypothetical protein GC170_07625 [bacterium]|nr:hypothetical protein [bacterium]